MTRLHEALAFEGTPPGLNGFDWGREAAERVEERMRSDGAHDAGHLARVYQNARRIARGERTRGEHLDWEVVAAAVVFHDVVNAPKDSDARADASARSAKVAEDFFEVRDLLGDERRELVCEAIEQHSYSRGLEPNSAESAILQDADRLEAIGAVGAARCFWVSGSMDGGLAHPTDPFARARDRDDTAFAVDHFFEKLLELRGTFRTATGRRLAEERHRFLVDFLEQFADEVGVDPPSGFETRE